MKASGQSLPMTRRDAQEETSPLPSLRVYNLYVTAVAELFCDHKVPKPKG